jgi:hypothetical protein
MRCYQHPAAQDPLKYQQLTPDCAGPMRHSRRCHWRDSTSKYASQRVDPYSDPHAANYVNAIDTIYWHLPMYRCRCLACAPAALRSNFSAESRQMHMAMAQGHDMSSTSWNGYSSYCKWPALQEPRDERVRCLDHPCMLRHFLYKPTA